MNEEMRPAVVAMQRKLEQQLKDVADTKRAINMVLKIMGEPTQYEEEGGGVSGVIRPDQFYGKGFATAATEYLEMRKQACQPSDILNGLREGGFDIEVMGWKEKDALRSLAISLAKNNVKFHKLKNGSFGLRAWYDEDFLKRAGKQKSEAAAAREQDAEEDDLAAVYVPKAGDFIQWEPNGVMQFTEAKRIIRISDDGAFAFVADSPTGMPVEELVLQDDAVAQKAFGKGK